jgi:hypothetical protein
MEIFKKISGFEGKFLISNKGNVKRESYKTRNRHGEYFISEKNKKKTISRSGYYVCSLAGKTFLVHRLIALAFIPNPNLSKYDCINHIDGNKLNNNLDNLEWCDRKQNNIHAYKTELKKGYWKGKSGFLNHSSKRVEKYDLNMNLLCVYGSASEAARFCKLHQSSISKCARGERSKYAGFIWKYSESKNINTLNK